MRFVYFHGFGSSPRSTKAAFYRQRFQAAGLELVVPELAPDFRRTAISDELKLAEEQLEDETVLLGSSLGGYLSTLVASRNPSKVKGLVLLAPAFDVPGRWRDKMTAEQLADWKRAGTKPFANHASGADEPLEYRFFEDACAHPPVPEVSCPALVIAGRNDDVVPLRVIEPFGKSGLGRRYLVLETGHEMTDVLDRLWEETWRFLAEIGAVER